MRPSSNTPVDVSIRGPELAKTLYKGLRISVVVPARNEEQAIREVIRSVPDFVDRIVVIDDASNDGTFQAASMEKDLRLSVIRHRKNLGVGGAILTGHKICMALGSEVNVVMAGDGQMDPGYLSRLLDAVIEEGVDYAKGNRFISKGHSKGMPTTRIVGNLILSFMTKCASGYWSISDSQNGYTAVRTSVLKDLDLNGITKGYMFENDMLINLGIAGHRVKDIPVPARYPSKYSQINMRRFVLSAFPFLVRGFFRRWIVSGLRKRKGSVGG